MIYVLLLFPIVFLIERPGSCSVPLTWVLRDRWDSDGLFRGSCPLSTRLQPVWQFEQSLLIVDDMKVINISSHFRAALLCDAIAWKKNKVFHLQSNVSNIMRLWIFLFLLCLIFYYTHNSTVQSHSLQLAVNRGERKEQEYPITLPRAHSTSVTLPHSYLPQLQRGLYTHTSNIFKWTDHWNYKSLIWSHNSPVMFII